MKKNKKEKRSLLSDFFQHEYQKFDDFRSRSALFSFYFIVIPFLFLFCFGFLLLSAYFIFGSLLYSFGFNVFFIPNEISGYQIGLILLSITGIGLFLLLVSWYSLKGLIYCVKTFFRLNKEK